MNAILYIQTDGVGERAVVQASAEARGFELVSASTQQEALAALAALRDDHDLVIIDLDAGQLAVDVMRTISGAEDSPAVVVLGGTADLGAVATARRCGAAAFVRKPYTEEKLSAVIAQVVRSTNRAGECATCDQWGHPHRNLILTSK